MPAAGQDRRNVGSETPGRFDLGRPFIRAYIINLDSALDRWSFVEKSFAGSDLEVCRVAGIDGNALKLPIPEYNEGLYRAFHGRPTSPGHVGCYLSHVKAMEAFLETDEEFALIGEDDLILGPDFAEVLLAALETTRHWNVLRLTGLSEGHPLVLGSLSGEYALCIGLGRLKGTGAYLIDRRGARVLAKKLLPMRLPIDHAMDREWFFGLRAAYVQPFPASQVDSGFRSSIQRGKTVKLSRISRYLLTYPYQMLNESARLVFRGVAFIMAKIAFRLA